MISISTFEIVKTVHKTRARRAKTKYWRRELWRAWVLTFAPRQTKTSSHISKKWITACRCINVSLSIGKGIRESWSRIWNIDDWICHKFTLPWWLSVMGTTLTLYYRVFSHDVTAAILVSQNKWIGGHVGVPNQSCGSWTLFLCKHFLLFQ